MKIIERLADLRRFLEEARREARSIGFVPTMGALHEGHLALCRASTAANDLSVASIFVNPLQFGPTEDFSRYPRSLQADGERLDTAGIKVLFTPVEDAVYPPGFQTYVSVDGLSGLWEGESRPGHFRGVATVVLKLFNMVGPCRAYFGEKDFQQLQVIRRMVVDLDVPVEVHAVPTVREPDGLAMSSRNRYLSPEERRAAPTIYRALLTAQDLAAGGTVDAGELLQAVQCSLESEPLLQPEYTALVDPETLLSVQRLEGRAVLAISVRLGKARLIDNMQLSNASAR